MLHNETKNRISSFGILQFICIIPCGYMLRERIINLAINHFDFFIEILSFYEFVFRTMHDLMVHIIKLVPASLVERANFDDYIIRPYDGQYHD